MSLKDRSFFGNPILERMRRHAGLATLLRSVSAVPALQAAQWPSASSRHPGGDVVKATLLPPATSLPLGQVIGMPPDPTVSSLPEGRAVQRAQGTLAPVGPAPTMQPETRLPSVSGIDPESQTDSTEWRRLETILRKHQQAQRSGELATEANTVQATARRDPGTQRSPSLRRESRYAQRLASAPAPARGRPGPSHERPAADTEPIPAETPIAEPQRPLDRPAVVVEQGAVQLKRGEADPLPVASTQGTQESDEAEARGVIPPYPAVAASPSRVAGVPGAGRRTDAETGRRVYTTTAEEAQIPGLGKKEVVGQAQTEIQREGREGSATAGGPPVLQRSTDVGAQETVTPARTTEGSRQAAAFRHPSEPSVPAQTNILQATESSGARSPVPRPSLPEGYSPGPDIYAQAEPLTTVPDDIAAVPTRLGSQLEAQEPAPGPQVQPVPLQEAWPVQRRPAFTPASATDPEAGPYRPPSRVREDVNVQRVEREADLDGIPEVLQEIASGRPTDSSIEVIPPRRPRPMPTYPERSRIAKAPDEGTDDRTRPGSVESQSLTRAEGQRSDTLRPQQTVPPPALPRAEPPAARSSLTQQSSPIQSRQGTRAETVQSQTRKQTPDHDTIQTAIGPLPADLWQLLGKSPPERATVDPVTGDLEPSPTEHDAAVKRAIAAAEARPGSPVAPTSDGQTGQGMGSPTVQRVPSHEASSRTETSARDVTVLQRRPDEDEVDAEALNQPAARGAGAQGEGQTSEGALDTDELARRVYAQIRRRLAVEWERARPRF